MDSRAGFTARLAGFAARHAWPALGVWALVLGGALLLAGSLSLTSEGRVTTTDAARAGGDGLRRRAGELDTTESEGGTGAIAPAPRRPDARSRRRLPHSVL